MFDELNYFDYDVEEIEQKLKAYFKEMPNITDEQVEERADIGKEIFNLMLMLMFLAQGSSTVGMVQDIDYYTEMIQRRYTDIVDDKYGMDSYYSKHIDNFALQTVNTTLEHITDEYYTSQERALNIAENEANSIANYADYRKAVESGKTGKKWLTQHDKKVRKTHNEVDGEIKPIDKPFIVGASLMMFPHDESLGADAKEIIHCRCHIKYLGQSEYKSITNDDKFSLNGYENLMKNDNITTKVPLRMDLQYFAQPKQIKGIFIKDKDEYAKLVQSIDLYAEMNKVENNTIISKAIGEYTYKVLYREHSEIVVLKRKRVT